MSYLGDVVAMMRRGCMENKYTSIARGFLSDGYMYIDGSLFSLEMAQIRESEGKYTVGHGLISYF